MNSASMSPRRIVIFCDPEFPVMSVLPDLSLWAQVEEQHGYRGLHGHHEADEHDEHDDCDEDDEQYEHDGERIHDEHAKDREHHEQNELRIIAAAELAQVLEVMTADDCFVNLHAPYFPKSAWTAIAAYLRRGGNWLNVGGAPFKRPVRQEGEQWIIEAEQTAYHQELYIHETLKVSTSKVATMSASKDIPLLAGQEELLELTDTWNLVPHTTRSSDLPHQMGSAGPMSTHIHPLLTGVSEDGRSIAAMAVLWEHSRGIFTGSRWMFVHVPLTASFWEKGGAATLLEWASFCTNGVTELSLKPNYASYEPEERVVLMLQTQILQRGRRRYGEAEVWTLDLQIERESRLAQDTIGQEVAGLIWEHRLHVEVGSEQCFERVPLPFAIQSGLYRIRCLAQGPHGEQRVLHQGFWGHDAELLAAGESIGCGRDYFIKDHRSMPVVGMTYMASDVARKYLFLPNAAVWDRDMAQMARAGINWIRTGIWTAYRNIMQVDGHASEEVLRAIDSFLLTAKRHGLQVTFTFFSFTPELWEGVNPYLDPQSVEAQKRFIRSIVSRHRQTTNVDWDLINEPSLFDPVRIFSDGPRSVGDSLEQEAFVAWLQQRHGEIETLQEAWNMSSQQLPDFAAAAPGAGGD